MVTAWEREQGALVHPGVPFAEGASSFQPCQWWGRERTGLLYRAVLDLQLYQGVSAEGLGGDMPGDMLGAAGTLLPQRDE